jgi:D-serine deaminase-like pyridoxal phosphate-dependent protein
VEEVKSGDILGILPVHSCLTANLMKSYMTLEGEAINY